MIAITMYRQTGKRKICKCEKDQVTQMKKAGWSTTKPSLIEDVLKDQNIETKTEEKVLEIGSEKTNMFQK